MLRKAKKQRKFLSSKLSDVSSKPIDELLLRRQKRVKMVKRGAGFGSALGGITGGAIAFAANPSFRKGVAMIAGLTVAVVALTASDVNSRAIHTLHLKKANHLVGKGLAEEAKTNRELKSFLGEWRYVIVDRHGGIKGTNRKRILGIGRLRLETNKILAGKY